MNLLTSWAVTWNTGDAASQPMKIGADSPTGVDLPSGFQGTRLAIEVALDPGSAGYKPLYDSTGTAVAWTLPSIGSNGARLAMLPDAVRGQGWIRLVSDQAQGAARVATLLGYR